jgi:excisionase family DNA binding protein
MQFQDTAMPAGGAELPKYLRVAAVAARFDVDDTTIYRDIKAGRLRAIRIGKGRGTVRVPADALADYEVSRAAAALAEVA